MLSIHSLNMQNLYECIIWIITFLSKKFAFSLEPCCPTLWQSSSSEFQKACSSCCIVSENKEKEYFLFIHDFLALDSTRWPLVPQFFILFCQASKCGIPPQSSMIPEFIDKTLVSSLELCRLSCIVLHIRSHRQTMACFFSLPIAMNSVVEWPAIIAIDSLVSSVLHKLA